MYQLFRACQSFLERACIDGGLTAKGQTTTTMSGKRAKDKAKSPLVSVLF